MVRSNGYRVDVYRGGARLKSLKAASAPRVDADGEAAIKTSLSGSFLYDPDVDYLNDTLRPVILLDGVEYASGVYHIASRTDSRTETGAVLTQLECYDNCFILKSTCTEHILHFSAGTNYIAAVQQLLNEAGIVLCLTTPTTAVLSTAREDWDVGTDYLTIINQLLSEINYDELWFNSDGYAVLRPRKSLDAAEIDHSYSADDRLSLVRPTATSETDVFSQPNVFVVICSNPDLSAPMIATAVNDNPLSDLSTFRRGRRIAQVYKVDNIASQEDLQAYAQNLCNMSILQSEIVTVETAIHPGHGVNDIVALHHPLASGIYRETAWSMTLSPGQSMTHTLRRIIIV